MSIYTIEEFDIEKFDNKVNQFVESHLVFATQTHVTYLSGSSRVLHTAVLFHNGPKKV